MRRTAPNRSCFDERRLMAVIERFPLDRLLREAKACGSVMRVYVDRGLALRRVAVRQSCASERHFPRVPAGPSGLFHAVFGRSVRQLKIARTFTG